MTHRYTIPQLIMESQATLRNDAFRRKTSGFRYWLFVPLAAFLSYWAIAWFAYIGMSDVAERLRARRDRRSSH